MSSVTAIRTTYFPTAAAPSLSEAARPAFIPTATFRLHVTVGGEFLEGEWRADRRPEYSYRVVERDHCMQSEYWGGYSRHNKLYREVYDAEGRCVDVQYVTRNDALMMYSPFLAENAQPGKRPADNQRPGYE